MKSLVLNQDYSPISVCSVNRAFVLYIMNKVELVSEFEGRMLHSVDRAYPMPAVVKLARYINVPFKSVELSRLNVFKRDSFTCQYCGAEDDLSLDHVVPRSKGGLTNWKNLVTACKQCNSLKGDDLTSETSLSLRIKPFKPSYIMFLRDFSGYQVPEWSPFLGVAQAVRS